MWAIKSMQATEADETGFFKLQFNTVNFDSGEHNDVEFGTTIELMQEILSDLTELLELQQISMLKKKREAAAYRNEN